MWNWKAQVQDLLLGLSRTHARDALHEIQRILRGVLEAQEVRFLDRDGHDLPAEMPLQQALPPDGPLSVLRLDLAMSRTVSEGRRRGESRFREGAPPLANLSTDQRHELFLKEFIRLAERHEFMWAGYIVRELLPRLGFAPHEAKAVLDELRAEQLVTISKVPNPKNPEFPATGVKLNCEHPRVKALLAAELRSGESNPAAGAAVPETSANGDSAEGFHAAEIS